MEFVSGLFNLSSNMKVDVQLGNNTVRYKGAISEIDDGVSIWGIQMLGGITISDEYHEHIFRNSFVAMITGPLETLDKLKIEDTI